MEILAANDRRLDMKSTDAKDERKCRDWKNGEIV